MKYRTKSADVLNEADRLERILDWQLFCIGQEKLLFGHTEDRDGAAWTPGDPIHFEPREKAWMIEYDEMFFDENRNDDDYLSSFGNCIRPIVQTYEFDEDLGDEDFYGDRVQRLISYPHVECQACGVGWKHDETCWMCGTTYEHLLPKMPLKFYASSTPRVAEGSIEMSADGMTFTGRLDFSGVQNTVFSEEAQEQVRRAVGNISVGFEPVRQAVGRAVPTFREMASHMHFFVERDVMLTEQLMHRIWGESDHYSIAPNQFSIEPYGMVTPPSNPLVREEREIVLVEPVVPDLPEMADVVPNLHIQPGWEADVFGHIDERFVPQSRDLDNLRQNTEVHQSRWPGIEIVTERRRR